MNSHQKRKVKRAHLKVQRTEAIGAKRELERKVPHEKDRFKENPTIEQLFEYMKSEHLKK